MNSCWRLLIGDYDWDELVGIGRLETSLWFWMFTILLQTIMLNMLLAVILDKYTDVKGNMGSADTLMTQSAEIYHRWRDLRAGKILSLEGILQTLDPTDLDNDDEGAEDVQLTPSAFMERVPGLSEEQSHDILKASKVLQAADDRGDVSLSEAMIRIMDIDKRQVHMRSK